MAKRRLSLKAVYMIAMTLVFGLAFFIFIILDVQSNDQQGQTALLEEARVFADEMDAVWEFMDIQQDRINYTADGEFEFKGLQCSIVGRSVGAIFSAKSDYEIRYTNFQPRNLISTPDEFEEQALTTFQNDRSVTEYYGIVPYEGKDKFRYLRVLEVTDNCLVCHGEPAGSLDELTGYTKEGWTLDSIGGAISIVIPLDIQLVAARNNVTRDAFYFLGLTLLIGITIYGITSRFVFRPLEQVTDSFGQLKRGNLATLIHYSRKTSEINKLIEGFNDMAKELNSSYSNLEGEVENRTQELVEANKTLEELNEKLQQEMEYKSDFLAMVSHELRTPLTSIITFSQLSQESDLETTNEKTKKSWIEIEKNSRTLLSMINNMLDIARTDAGKITAERDFMDLGDIVASLKTTISPLAQKANVSFEAHIAADVPLVKGDFEKTLRILENLTNNAIKFTPEKGTVQLLITYTAEEKAVLIKVVDSGIGISEEDQKRIFERFVQVDTGPTRKFGGSGLGLSLVKEYAELQNFEILVESQLGHGASFIIRIPKDLIIFNEEV